MIKLTLVQFIRQFSLKRSWLEFNYLFFITTGITLASILVVYVAISIFDEYLGHNYFFDHGDFMDKIYSLITESQRGGAKQLNVMLTFNLMLIAIFKLHRSDQIERGPLSSTLLSAYFKGLLFIFLGTIFLCNGMDWLLGDAMHIFGYGGMFFVQWLNTILNLVLPGVAFYLAYHYLLQGLEERKAYKFWPVFGQTIFLYLIISTVIALITVVFTSVIMQPVFFIFSFGGSAVSIVLGIILVVGLLNFFMIMASDLLIIMLNKKAGAPVSEKSNPDLLDN